MKKKKLLNLIVVIILSVFSLTLAACGGGGNSGGGSGSGGGQTLPDTKNPTDDDGNPLPIEDLFSGFKIVYNDNSAKIEGREINEFLEDQFMVLAHDIIYRLTTVYGGGTVVDFLLLMEPDKADQDVYGNNALKLYENYIGKALISNYNLITNPTIKNNNPEFYYSDGQTLANGNYAKINEPSAYHFELNAYEYKWIYNSNVGARLSKNFNLADAIIGGYTYENSAFSSTINPSNAWKMKYSESSNNAFSKYNEMMENYQMQIAKGIAGAMAYDGEYINTNNYELSEIVQDIDYLGFFQSDRQLVLEYIYHQIIGIENIYKDTYDHMPSFLNDYILNDSNQGDLSDDNHLYKAYEVIIPSMVDRIFSNSLGGIEIDRRQFDENFGTLITIDGKVQYHSIDKYGNYYKDTIDYYSVYPKVAKVSDTDIGVLNNETDENGSPVVQLTPEFTSLKSIILKPKINISLVELWMYVSAETNYSVDFKVNIKYVANGVTYLNDIISSTTNPNSDKSIFKIHGEFDSKSIDRNSPEPWSFDLVVEKGILKENNKYIGIDSSGRRIEQSEYPVMRSYNGYNSMFANRWLNAYDFSENSGEKVVNYKAGDNYVEISIIQLNAYLVNGDHYQKIDKNVPLKIGFIPFN